MLKDTYKERIKELIGFHYNNENRNFDKVCKQIADEFAESGDDESKEYVLANVTGKNVFLSM